MSFDTKAYKNVVEIKQILFSIYLRTKKNE
jgi:hypothetical protein